MTQIDPFRANYARLVISGEGFTYIMHNLIGPEMTPNMTSKLPLNLDNFNLNTDRLRV